MILLEAQASAINSPCPHTRGDDPSLISSVISLLVLVPTRVGMILDERKSEQWVNSCPHTRGDDPLELPMGAANAALSPHAWG